jgi:hypothetical protein
MFPSAYQAWQKANTGDNAILKLTGALKKYAYQPFSGDANVNTIDPRTYFWIQEYLLSLKNPAADTAFITTWLLDLETDRTSFYKDYAMPFNVNNVDASVGANAVHGLLRSVLFDPKPTRSWFDNDLQKLVGNTVDLLSWVVNTRILDRRPDLVLLYYMGNYNFYWFVSRTVYLLNSYDQPLPYKVLSDAQSKLQKAMRSNGTQAIMDLVQYEESAVHHWAYWDNFLGVSMSTLPFFWS